MKKLLYSSVALTVFSLSIFLFQISCQKEAISKGASSQNKFLYTIVVGSTWQYWIANTDGTNPVQITISLPVGLKPTGSGKLTPNGDVLIFPVVNDAGTDRYIYSINTNGTNLLKIKDAVTTIQLDINQTF